MSRKFDYSIVQLVDAGRNERLNAALAIFSENHLEVRLPRRFDKLRAISAAMDLDDVKEALMQIPRLDKLARESGRNTVPARIEALTALTYLEFSNCAYFEASSSSIFEARVVQLMKTLIDPEPATLRFYPKKTKLVSLMKLQLRNEGVLAKKGEDLSRHRVVANVQIAEGLSADFVLKNGSMHVIETVDASDGDISPRKVVLNIALAALVLEQARMTFGQENTRSRLVYEASPEIEKVAKPSLEAAEHQGAHLVNWASERDRRLLLDDLIGLATPYDETRRRKRPAIQSGTQRQFDIN